MTEIHTVTRTTTEPEAEVVEVVHSDPTAGNGVNLLLALVALVVLVALVFLLFYVMPGLFGTSSVNVQIRPQP